MEHKPFVKEVVYVAPQKDWSFPLHSHEETAELSLIISGSGTCYAQGTERHVKKGMLVAKNPGLSHSEKSSPEDPLEQICIEIDGVQQGSLPRNFVLPDGADPVIETGSDFPLLKSIFRYLMDNHKNPKEAAICSGLLESALSLIEKNAAAAQPTPEKRQRSKKELVSELLSYLDAHYTEKLKISDLADAFYVSEGTLSRKFKAVTGYTVNEYIISKRMGEAQRMLVFDDAEIKDVAERCGYDDLQYFYHVFKSYAKCTPAEFREKYK